ncbi:hypothetical protein, partial [Cronobacter sakazakii]|uniref:hypothetical protein n=1 Tax=Cronobacter sakazakii TaxID=28141 RepID=UPI001F1A6E74
HKSGLFYNVFLPSPFIGSDGDNFSLFKFKNVIMMALINWKPFFVIPATIIFRKGLILRQ